MSGPLGPGHTEPARIPTKLDELLGFCAKCSCGKTHQSPLSHAEIAPGALERIVDTVHGIGRNLTILVVVDRITRTIAGEKTQQLLGKDGHHVGLLTLPDSSDGRPHADEPSLSLVHTAMNGVDLAVAVGSGTVNDLTKLTSFRLGIPYIAVATAPSMNGYTSAIAAILVNGVKRTVDCHQPFAVIADIDLLKAAPHHLIAAGLGDLESKPTATADFRLSGLLRNSYYCSAPEKVVLDAEKRAAENAAGLRTREVESVQALTEALILSGISMTLAGSSSPASGGEHLISHFLDMTCERDGRVEGWHGAQVGVATLITAALYEHLRSRSPNDIDIERIIADRTPREAPYSEIRRIHGPFADEVIAEHNAKYLAPDDLTKELSAIQENWSSIWRNLDEVLRSPSRIKRILKAAGAPTTASELGLEMIHLERAFAHARFIRRRFTVLDFADDLGVFEALAPIILTSLS